jgi:hypothetical protein
MSYGSIIMIYGKQSTWVNLFAFLWEAISIVVNRGLVNSRRVPCGFAFSCTAIGHHLTHIQNSITISLYVSSSKSTPMDKASQTPAPTLHMSSIRVRDSKDQTRDGDKKTLSKRFVVLMVSSPRAAHSSDARNSRCLYSPQRRRIVPTFSCVVRASHRCRC